MLHFLKKMLEAPSLAKLGNICHLITEDIFLYPLQVFVPNLEILPINIICNCLLMLHGFKQHSHRENILLPVKSLKSIEETISDIRGVPDDQEYEIDLQKIFFLL
jgi:hypothetical protein